MLRLLVSTRVYAWPMEMKAGRRVLLITTFVEPIWPCIEATMDYFVERRKERIPSLVKAGLNFSIVLGSACYVEGVLEGVLRGLLNYRRAEFNRVNIDDTDLRRAMNNYYERLEDELSRNIGRAIGASGYDELFAILAGQPLNRLRQVKPLWEGITVLFNFRNVLGHGREVSARHFTGGAIPGGLREEFLGSYRLVEEYLRKNRLLSRRFVEAHSEYLFLSAPIADHFLKLAKALPEAVLSSLPTDERDACKVFNEERVTRGSSGG
jgi:hypothetical protein